MHSAVSAKPTMSGCTSVFRAEQDRERSEQQLEPDGFGAPGPFTEQGRRTISRVLKNEPHKDRGADVLAEDVPRELTVPADTIIARCGSPSRSHPLSENRRSR
jgi:hypothetical protein